jgi:flavodoxin
LEEAGMERYRFLTRLVFCAVLCIMVTQWNYSIPQATGQPGPQEQPAVVKKPKALVVYYSRTGNTKAIAESVREVLGADIQEIKDMKDRSGFFGYIGGMIDVKKCPITEISPKEFNLKDYDLLLIGSPGWGMKFAPAITTFFNIADFTGKKVVLFGVASARIKQATLDEYSKLISSKGGKVIDTFLIKTLWLDRNEMKGEAKKISIERAGKWMR